MRAESAFFEGIQRADGLDVAVGNLFGDAHNCETFRVRSVFNAKKVALRLWCRSRKNNERESFDATMSVDGAGRISALDDAIATTEAY